MPTLTTEITCGGGQGSSSVKWLQRVRRTLLGLLAQHQIFDQNVAHIMTSNASLLLYLNMTVGVIFEIQFVLYASDEHFPTSDLLTHNAHWFLKYEMGIMVWSLDVVSGSKMLQEASRYMDLKLMFVKCAATVVCLPWMLTFFCPFQTEALQTITNIKTETTKLKRDLQNVQHQTDDALKSHYNQIEKERCVKLMHIFRVTSPRFYGNCMKKYLDHHLDWAWYWISSPGHQSIYNIWPAPRVCCSHVKVP